MKRVVIALLLTFSLFSGVVVADTANEWSFEREISEGWEVTEGNSRDVTRSTDYYQHGFYSLEWNDSNAPDYDYTNLVTKDVDYIDPNHTEIEFNYYQNNSGTDYDRMRLILATPEENIVFYGDTGQGGEAWVGGSQASFANAPEPPNNEWVNVRIIVRDTSIKAVITAGTYNETITTNMSSPIQNPESTKLKLSFYNYGLDSAGDQYYVDPITVTQPTPELVSYDLPSIAFVFVIIALFFFVGMRVYSVATIVMSALTCMAAIAVMVFDTTESALWITMILTVLVIMLSAANFYKSVN